MVEDKIFMSLDFWVYKVTNKDIAMFLDAIDHKRMPDAFMFETTEGWFKVNRIKKEFRILKRKEHSDFEKSLESDVTIMAMYKTAKRSGYKCFLETKYMN
jgi:hypothetical protein